MKYDCKLCQIGRTTTQKLYITAYCKLSFIGLSYFHDIRKDNRFQEYKNNANSLLNALYT